MPSTDTITSFYSFTAQTVIQSAQMNTNFSNFRGHLIPIDPSTATAINNTYDLGSGTYKWRRVYGKPWLTTYVATTGSMTITNSHDVVEMDSTSATTTATLFAVANNTGASFYIANLGTANNVLVDANSSETINGTTTVFLLPGETAFLYCTGAKWLLF